MSNLLLVVCAIILLLSAACSDHREDDSAVEWELSGGELNHRGETVLEGLPEGISLVPDTNGGPGAFLILSTGDSQSGYFRWPGIKIAGMDRFTALYRELPWWMSPVHGSTVSEIPLETQCLLWHRTDGRTGLLLPLLDKGYRMNVGGGEDGLMLTADNNMPEGESGLKLRGAYFAVGDDPYVLLEEAFTAAVSTMGVGRLRRDKNPPRWIDRLGWCTWNSFYHAVTHQGVLDGLESFARGGISPAWMILDDGWQEAREYGFLMEQTWLTGLGENRKKFPGGLNETITMAREKYSVQDFLVWQTLQGYWHGIDTSRAELAGFHSYTSVGRSNRPINERTAEWVPMAFNVPLAGDIEAFYEAYHGRLAALGVNGVKVDNQSHLEFMTWGMGPVTEVMGAYKRALERSVDKHFGSGNLINCMGMGADALFQAVTSTVTRNSNDFFPNQPESHCRHLAANAFNNLMTAWLVLPDWDMFQSGHEWGAYHASARAISGGPVYLSDRPGEQDFTLIGKVSLADGRVPRCPGPALPTEDILFRDPLNEDVLLKVFNRNLPGAWALGAWNCRWDSLRVITVTDSLAVSLLPGTAPEKQYAVWAFEQGRLSLCGHSERWSLSLGRRGFEVYTVAEVDRGVAPLGNLGMYNSSGIFEDFGWTGPQTFEARVMGGGRIGFYCEKAPSEVKVFGQAVRFEYDSSGGLLSVRVPGVDPAKVILAF